MKIEIAMLEMSVVPNFNKLWVLLMFEMSVAPNFNKLCTFKFGTNLSRTGGKYFLKIIFDIKIEIAVLEILDWPDFDKFWAFLILETFWA